MPFLRSVAGAAASAYLIVTAFGIIVPLAALAAAQDYHFEVAGPPVKSGKATVVKIRLVHIPDGKPVTGADVTATFAMLDMEMGTQEYQLTETSPGVYSRLTPALVMVGHWGLSFNVTPKGGQPFTAVVVDRATG